MIVKDSRGEVWGDVPVQLQAHWLFKTFHIRHMFLYLKASGSLFDFNECSFSINSLKSRPCFLSLRVRNSYTSSNQTHIQLSYDSGTTAVSNTFSHIVQTFQK